MSGLMNKVKDALSGDKHTSEAAAANQGSNGKMPSFFHQAYRMKYLTSI